MPRYVDATTNKWAILGLIACDASYQATIPTGQPLAEYFDSAANTDFLPQEMLKQAGINSYFDGGALTVAGWAAVEQLADSGTGFGVVLYQTKDKTQVIVSFTGTNGLNGQDWWTNVNLGVDQWRANRPKIDEAVLRLTGPDGQPFTGEILFTGQSLGGALAEYAAYDYATRNPSRTPNVRLITFNGLGGVDGIKEMLGSFDPSRLGAAKIAHFYINNDVVSRLGGGHVQASPSEYVLNSYVEYPERSVVEHRGYTRIDPAYSAAQNFVDAHRIESGFYRHFAKYDHDFTDAEEASLVPIAAAGIQKRGAAFAGFLSDPKNYSESEAWVRLASSAGAMLSLLGPDDVTDFNITVDAFTAHLAAADSPRNGSLYEKYANGLKLAAFVPQARSMATALAVAGWTAAQKIAETDQAASTLATSPLSNWMPESIRTPLASIVSSSVSNAVLAGKAAVGLATLAGSLTGSSNDFPALTPDQVGWDLGSEDWQAAFIGTITKEALEQGKPAGQVLAEVVIGMNEIVEPITEAYDPEANLAMHREVADAVIRAGKAIGNAFDDLTAKATDTLFDVGSSLSRITLKDAVEGVLQVITGSTNAYGQPLDTLGESAPDSTIAALAEAARIVADASQVVVVRPGHGTNPFDEDTFANENAVTVKDLREGGVSTFTLFLPYAADENGQHVKLRLAGPNADRFQVLLQADPVAVAGDGTFELTVPEGSRQLVFGLRAAQDIDVDQVLSVEAMLTDDDGNPTHRNHAELTINFDAVTEAPPTVGGTVSGTTLDDNRNGTGGRKPVAGTAGNERVQGLAGRDEASGNGGNDIVEGGAGIDVVTGDSGDDQVFGDVQLNEAQIQAYIASSGTAATSGSRPPKLFVTSSEWLQGGLGSDTVVGTSADDIVFGGGGKDLLVGGTGHDLLNGDDSYRPGDITTAYVETAVGTGAPFNNYYSSILSDAGSVGDADVIHAGSGDDVVSALFGNDTVWGDDGHDVISGGDADDSLLGGNGNDQIAGDSYGAIIGDAGAPFIGDDFIAGDDGNDKLYGDGGDDTLLGGDGNDEIRGNNNIAEGGVSPSAGDDGHDYLSGGAGNDNLVGDSADDVIDGDEGDDVLLGDSDATPAAFQGNDQLDGGAGNDAVRGYGGEDMLVGGDGNDTLQADDGDDAAFGDSGEDHLTGGNGADFLAGGADDDKLLGGLGDDELEGDGGNDNLAGEEGADRIVGNDGDDFLFGDSDAAAGANAGGDYLDGGSGNDYLRGYGGDDGLHGGTGDDQLKGESGADSLFGDAGNDALDGGDGNDMLDGGAANDTIWGQEGDDRIDGGVGVNALFGGDGNDTFLVNDVAANWVNDPAGTDRVAINTVQSIDEIVARRNGETDDLVLEAAGGQTIIVGGMQGAGPQTIVAGDGSTISLADLIAAANASTDVANPPLRGTAGDDQLDGTPHADAMMAYEGEDWVAGHEGNDRIDGGPGSDWLVGGSDDDEIIGGTGADQLVGNTGDDSLIGGLGDDWLEGGSGADRYYFSRGDGQDQILDDGGSATPGEVNQLIFGPDVRPEEVTVRTDGENDLLLGIGGSSDTVLWQDAFKFSPPQSYANAFGEMHFADGTVWSLKDVLSDLMQGTAGDDEIFGTHWNDVIDAGAGDDRVLAGTGGNDIVHAGAGDDWVAAGDYSTIHGDHGNDFLRTALGAAFGGEGDDDLDNQEICGDFGSATLAGGPGDDVIAAGGNGSVIRFGPGDGHDRVVTRSDYFQWGGPNERDTEIHFTDGIRPENVSAVRQGNDLVITVAADASAGANLQRRDSGPDVGTSAFTPSTISLVGFFAHPTTAPNMQSERFMFDDDSGVSAQWLIDRGPSPHGQTITGTAGRDTLNGSDGADTIDGLDEADNLVGGAGSDTLRGGAGLDGLGGGFGDDVLSGGDGDDSLGGNAGNDNLSGDAGNDMLRGHRGNNRMYGGAGNDTLEAVDGDDLLDGGAGDDILTGGSGSNTYVFDRGYGTDMIMPRGGMDAFEVGLGLDTVQFGAGIAPADVELRTAFRVTGYNDLEVSIDGGNDLLYIRDFTGVWSAPANMQFKFNDGTVWDAAFLKQHIKGGTHAVDTLTGTPGDDVLAAYDSADRVLALEGNDEIDAGKGDDYIDGGAGADHMAGSWGNDTFVVDDAGDTVEDLDGNDSVVSSIDYALPSTIENLTLTGNAGTATGNEFDNTLTGNDRANRLDGGLRSDTMAGGAGDDTYFVDSTGDTVVESRDGGVDTVRTTVDHTLADSVENAVLLGTGPLSVTGNAFANVLTGNGASNGLDGGSGADTMAGGAGNDYYFVDDAGDAVTEIAGEGTDTVYSTISYTLNANVETLLLESGALDGTGNALNNQIQGNSAANILDGRQGNDSLYGFGGNDTYVVDSASDTIFESANNGTDTVISSVTHTLITTVEHLTLGGSAAINGTGNAAANVIVGNTGNNTLNGAAGADTMRGGAGNDVYVVDNAADSVVESAGEGTDTVQSGIALTLAVNVENLTLTGTSAINGTGNSLANAIAGNGAANTLNGGSGADTLSGGGGNDTYVVDNVADVVSEAASAGTDLVQASVTYALSANVENLTLTGSGTINGTGNALVNQLTGNAGANVLDGGGGADTLAGGTGNDTYHVDVAGDIVTEAAGAGTDTVNSTVTCSLAANVESLTLTGSSAINGTGNTLANVLTGNNGNNTLDGGAGVDTLLGGGGNDTYIVDNAGDTVTETAGQGTDFVQSSVTYALGANVENLTLVGNAAINATGNTADNVLAGNGAANVLTGGAGTDTMRGGAGNDTYVVDAVTDVVAENASEGTDLVQSSVTLTLAANLENLTLTGAAAINGTGNTLANALAGNSADNTLDGGAGADALAGGTGNDTYVVDNASDLVTEALSAGIDAISASVSYVTAANVEFLTLTGTATLNGTGNTLDNWLRGNTGINTMSGMDGNDTLWGNLGDDTVNGYGGNDLLQGGGGNDVLADTAGNNLLDGGAGIDALSGGAGREIVIGGTGADVVTTGGGADIIGFNKGDGADVVNASVGTDDTLSLGGGLAYSDLKLRKAGADLILDANNGDQITFRNWYQTGVNNKCVLNLQVVADAMAAYNPASQDPLLNKRVVTFNFGNLVSQFDAALQANPALASWSLTSGLSSAYLGGSDAAAIGGDFAYDFGHRNALTNIGASPAQSVLAAATFGNAAQSLQSPATLYSGTVRLA